MITKVLWFSRHEMTDTQKKALGEVEITQISRSINSAYELIDEIEKVDVVAIVAPLNLQSQFLKVAGNKPVIMAESERVLIKNPDGSEDKINFVFKRWVQLKKIDIVTEEYKPL